MKREAIQNLADYRASGVAAARKPAIQSLVETALRSIAFDGVSVDPRGRGEWVARLADSLISTSEVDCQQVLSSLISHGVTREELYQFYVPEAARHLGHKWLLDEVSFVDVTTGTGRLQALFREPDNPVGMGRMVDRPSVGERSALMVVPECEQHSLGAVVASDALRRHGFGVQVAIGLTGEEIARTIARSKLTFVGLSLSTWNSVEKAAELVADLRSSVVGLPTLIAGGSIVQDPAKVKGTCGVDFAVKSIREAIDCCPLSVDVDLTFGARTL